MFSPIRFPIINSWTSEEDAREVPKSRFTLARILAFIGTCFVYVKVEVEYLIRFQERHYWRYLKKEQYEVPYKQRYRGLDCLLLPRSSEQTLREICPI